jgi:hypothetical protein
VLSPGPAPRRGPLCPRGPRRTHRPTPRGGVLPGERCRPMLDYDVRCPGGGSVSFSGHLRNGQCRALTGFTSPTGCDPGRAGTRGWPPRAPDSPARTRRALRLLAVFRSAITHSRSGLVSGVHRNTTSMMSTPYSSARNVMPAWIIAGAPTKAAVVAAASSPAHRRRIRPDISQGSFHGGRLPPPLLRCNHRQRIAGRPAGDARPRSTARRTLWPLHRWRQA